MPRQVPCYFKMQKARVSLAKLAVGHVIADRAASGRFPVKFFAASCSSAASSATSAAT